MNTNILAIIVVGLALATLVIARMIFSELGSLRKRIDRLEGRFESRFESLRRSNASFTPPSAPDQPNASFTPPIAPDQLNTSLAQRVAYLEGLEMGRSGKIPFNGTEL